MVFILAVAQSNAENFFIFGEFPNLVFFSNLVVCNFHAETLFCGLAFALSLRAFACFCVRLRLEQPRLGIAEFWVDHEGSLWELLGSS